MATLEELYEKVVSDDVEKQALAQALTDEKAVAVFLAERGCDATPEELVALLKEKAGVDGEISDEALEGAGGGTGWDWLASIVTLAIGCAVSAAISAAVQYGVPDHLKNEHATGAQALDICHD